MQPRLNLLNNGQELQGNDINAMAQVASAADDQVLAELLRPPGNSIVGAAVSKYIQHYSYRTVANSIPYGDQQTTVIPNGATGGVQINPFRAIVGSRTAPGTNALLSLTDIRSAIFIGSATAIAGTVTFAANSSGNPRWDLVYAAVAVDGATANVTRYVKNPTTKVVNPTSVSVFLNTTVTVSAVTGTPGATPSVPTQPADTSTTFYIPIAAVRIPNGFTATSTVSTRDIRDQSPVIPIDRHTGVANLQPANGDNDGGGGGYATNFPWVAGSAGTRPTIWLPPGMMGGEQRFIMLDCQSGTPANWSHPPGSVVDSSVDWRNRLFLVVWQASTSSKFATDTTASGSGAVPYAGTRPTTSAMFPANSFIADAQLSAGNPTVLLLSHSDDTVNIAASAFVGLYVDVAGGTGKLLMGTSGSTPNCRLFVWLMATSCFPNA